MIGINLSGAEFGTQHRYGKDYIYPSESDLQFYADRGVEFVRLPIKWERIQSGLGGELNSAELGRLKTFMADAEAAGVKVIVDLHNYGRYGGNVVGGDKVPTAVFADFWQKMAVAIGGSPALLGYDLMNEPHDMNGGTSWKASAQAAVDAIRGVDMNAKIYVEGTGWASARHWTVSNNDLLINDPANKIVYEAHIYFDNDGAGIYDQSYDGEKAYATMGADRVKNFTDWLTRNGVEGFIGEFAVPGNDPRWLTVLDNFLSSLNELGIDAAYWGAGPWFGNYPLGLRDGAGNDRPQLDVLEKFLQPTAAQTLNGTAGNDVLKGDIGEEALNGGAGNDTLVGSLGTDRLDGGSGVDTADYSAGQRGIDIDLLRATQKGGRAEGDRLVGIETVRGTREADVLKGDDGANTLVGNAGDDLIAGRGGADVLDGGAGIDTLDYSESNAGLIIDLAKRTATGGHAMGDTITGFENVIGSAFADKLSGDAGNNVLNGGDGDDVLLTSIGGTDIYDGGAGRDTYDAGSSTKAVKLSLADGGSQWIRLISIEDLIGGSANDELTGDADTNRLVGNAGNDRLDGGAGADTMIGGTGNDIYYVDNAGDIVIEKAHEGADTVYVSASWAASNNIERLYVQGHAFVTLTGNALDNMIQAGTGGGKFDGGAGNDTITGGADNDWLIGGAGNDKLIGGAGRDTYTGGSGADTFVFQESDLGLFRDTITDFSRAEKDRIDVTKIDANVHLAGDQKFLFLGGTAFSGRAGEFRIEKIDGGQLLLGDTDGDTAVDITIAVIGNTPLVAGDLLL
ncbi:cellulase family glycosylhydrolase [Sphingobium xenophagum]|uniref:Endoglucanase n=1 Tax=Sphingobium xenophagum TaxID=121428 RepID=A0A401J6H6_SPHXE|nr:cellulase family glycosylhydrolase [Sphingobium xenophagum]GBH32190.1 endoglucanase [Sphingobium xenophagum]